MAANYPRRNDTGVCPSPQGGQYLDIDIPWEKLDAYSAGVAQDSGTIQDEGQLTVGAPEWNWWDMLNHLKLDLICKLVSVARIFAPHSAWLPCFTSKLCSSDWTASSVCRCNNTDLTDDYHRGHLHHISISPIAYANFCLGPKSPLHDLRCYRPVT